MCELCTLDFKRDLYSNDITSNKEFKSSVAEYKFLQRIVENICLPFDYPTIQLSDEKIQAKSSFLSVIN